MRVRAHYYPIYLFYACKIRNSTTMLNFCSLSSFISFVPSTFEKTVYSIVETFFYETTIKPSYRHSAPSQVDVIFN